MTLFAVYVTIVVLVCTFFLICKWNNVALSIPNIYDDGKPVVIIIFLAFFDAFNLLYIVFSVSFELNGKYAFFVNPFLFAVFIGSADCMSKGMSYLINPNYQEGLKTFLSQNCKQSIIITAYLAMGLAMLVKYHFTGLDAFQTLYESIFEIVIAWMFSWNFFVCDDKETLLKRLSKKFRNMKQWLVDNQKNIFISLANGVIAFCILLLFT